jgi:hypothetical protein
VVLLVFDLWQVDESFQCSVFSVQVRRIEGTLIQSFARVLEEKSLKHGGTEVAEILIESSPRGFALGE